MAAFESCSPIFREALIKLSDELAAKKQAKEAGRLQVRIAMVDEAAFLDAEIICENKEGTSPVSHK
jgi:hypothetical protein